jgi:hypothetical protein
MTRTTWTSRLLLALAVAALAATADRARAGLLPVSVTITPEAGNFRWTYAVVLPTDVKLQSGDYFTIYDFNGLVAGSIVAPDGWTPSVTKVGPTPERLNPEDDPGIDNLTFRYDGPIQIGQLGLGNFWAVSTYGEAEASFFTGRNPRAGDGTVDRNITETIVPTGSVVPPPGEDPPPPPPSGVPEPATLALAGLGLPLIGAARLLRRRKL